MSDAGLVLVAGIGNVFFGDDGFGVEVANRIDPAVLPPGVRVRDYGIRGVHLAYDLLDADVRTLVLIDALPMRDPPGTLAVVAADQCADTSDAQVEAHSMNPQVVLSTVRGLGGRVPRTYIVGCQPTVIEPVMGLSAPVSAVVDSAARLVVDLVRQLPPDLPAVSRQAGDPQESPGEVLKG